MSGMITARAVTVALTCLVGATVAVAAVGCSPGGGSDQAGVTAPLGNPGVSTAAPDAVATGYMRAVMAADFTAASTYVAPAQRDFIKALGLSSGPGTLQKMTGEVSVGATRVDGETGTAVFVGRMCRVQLGLSGTTEDPQCVENHDVTTDSPIFTVHLGRLDDAHWYVTLPTPTT